MKIQLSKKLLAALMTLTFSVVSANTLFADDMKENHRENAKARFEHMAKELNLTEQQKKDLKPMMKKHGKERMEAMKALHEKHNKELATVLNDEQMEKLKEMRKEKMKHMMQNREEGDED